MMIWDLNVAVLYGRFLSYRGDLYNRFDCIYISPGATDRRFHPIFIESFDPLKML